MSDDAVVVVARRSDGDMVRWGRVHGIRHQPHGGPGQARRVVRPDDV